jgi:signal transduction histidine kinase
MKNESESKSVRTPGTHHLPKKEGRDPKAGRKLVIDELPHLTDTGIGLDLLDFQDGLPFYVMLVDEDHRILQANNAVRTHLEVERKDILGHLCTKIVHGIDGPFEGCPLEGAVAAGGEKIIERDVFDPRSGCWLRSGIYPTNAFTSNGKRIFFHMVLDITDRKQAEEQLKASHERLRNLTAHLELVREEERKKIAHDLHDETSQLLASLNAYIEAAVGKLPNKATEIKGLLQKAQKSSIQILDELHKMVHELRPTIIDDFGLGAAIKWLIENSLEVGAINVDFRVLGKERTLSSELKTAIFRVVQEAINNILRHANAKNVVINLQFTKRILRIRIMDDGNGFDVERAINSKDRPHGLGIVGMGERVESFDGTFNIYSKEGKGTRITIQVPLETKVTGFQKEV